MKKLKFFISRSGADSHWVDIIDNVIKALGHESVHQDQDFFAGGAITYHMMLAAEADCTIALLSESYFKSEHCLAELHAALHSDPTGTHGRIIPVLVSRFRLPRLLAQLVYVKLVGLDAAAAHKRMFEVLANHRIDRELSDPISLNPAQVVRSREGGATNQRPDVHEIPLTPGEIRLLPTIDSLEVQSDQFSPEIIERMRELNHTIERLTGEQFRVITKMMSNNRVRISGYAGSGKTLLAAEKALRSAYAGYPTLFLCHSPLLAEDVRKKMKNSTVQVEDFGDWVRKLTGDDEGYSESSWTNYSEPDAGLLSKALDAITGGHRKYACIVVDEGQDFREEWWALVEAALLDSRASSLYIFHDDNQAILPYRSKYPIGQPVFDISLNCRNGGKIFEMMKVLSPGAPHAELQLRMLGAANLFDYAKGNEKAVILNALVWLVNEGFDGDLNAATKSIAVLYGGSTPLNQSALVGTYVIPSVDWQQSVKEEFKGAITQAETLKFPTGGLAEVERRLGSLSTAGYPTLDDIKLVQEVAKSFKVLAKLRRYINHKRARNKLDWIISDGKASLRRPGFASFHASEIIIHFENPDWCEGLPAPRSISFSPSREYEPGVIPINHVSHYKGLESDCVLLFVEGNTPFLTRELYVGISRARRLLAVCMDRQKISMLPRDLRPRWRK